MNILGPLLNWAQWARRGWFWIQLRRRLWSVPRRWVSFGRSPGPLWLLFNIFEAKERVVVKGAAWSVNKIELMLEEPLLSIVEVSHGNLCVEERNALSRRRECWTWLSRGFGCLSVYNRKPGRFWFWEARSNQGGQRDIWGWTKAGQWPVVMKYFTPVELSCNFAQLWDHWGPYYYAAEA